MATESRILAWAGIALIVLGWLVSAIWYLASLNTRVAGLEYDVARLVWIAEQQVGPPPPARKK